MILYNSRDEYYQDHAVCPKCLSGTGQTYIGFVFIKGKPYKDENSATCECGWSGIVDQLVNKLVDMSTGHYRCRSCGFWSTHSLAHHTCFKAFFSSSYLF